MKQIRQYINEKLSVDYSKYKIVIYTSKDNIEKLKNNKLVYIEKQETRINELEDF